MAERYKLKISSPGFMDELAVEGNGGCGGWMIVPQKICLWLSIAPQIPPFSAVAFSPHQISFPHPLGTADELWADRLLQNEKKLGGNTRSHGSWLSVIVRENLLHGICSILRAVLKFLLSARWWWLSLACGYYLLLLPPHQRHRDSPVAETLQGSPTPSQTPRIPPPAPDPPASPVARVSISARANLLLYPSVSSHCSLDKNDKTFPDLLPVFLASSPLSFLPDSQLRSSCTDLHSVSSAPQPPPLFSLSLEYFPCPHLPSPTPHPPTPLYTHFIREAILTSSLPPISKSPYFLSLMALYTFSA